MQVPTGGLTQQSEKHIFENNYIRSVVGDVQLQEKVMLNLSTWYWYAQPRTKGPLVLRSILLKVVGKGKRRPKVTSKVFQTSYEKA